MQKRSKAEKIIWIIALIVQALALLFGIVGTGLQFAAKKTVYYEDGYVYDPYTNQSYYRTGFYDYHTNPVAGVMPLVATLLTITGLVLLILSYKHKKSLAIAPIVFIIPTQLMYILNAALDIEGAAAWVGWVLTVAVATPLLFFNFILLIVYLAISPKGGEKTESNDVNYEKLRLCSVNLRELKALFDMQILSEGEYQIEKQKIMSSLGLGKIEKKVNGLDGTYVSGNTKIVIENKTFLIELNGKTLKIGDVEENEITGEVTLLSTDGMKTNFKKSANSLLSDSGTAYTKI